MTTSDTEATALLPDWNNLPQDLRVSLCGIGDWYSDVHGGQIALDIYNHIREHLPAQEFPLFKAPAVNDRDALLAQVEVMREALQNLMGIYDTPLSRRRYPPGCRMTSTPRNDMTALADECKFLADQTRGKLVNDVPDLLDRVETALRVAAPVSSAAIEAAKTIGRLERDPQNSNEEEIREQQRIIDAAFAAWRGHFNAALSMYGSEPFTRHAINSALMVAGPAPTAPVRDGWDEAIEAAIKRFRDTLCAMEWPPSDGDQLIDRLQADLRALIRPAIEAERDTGAAAKLRDLAHRIRNNTSGSDDWPYDLMRSVADQIEEALR